ncbi:MAG: ubiquinone/menaquinone biosynthesis methyltransferase [Planctomycetes bacterium]|nr:ubiquinone/menaquinone biosynthesis methyltransferase [Planctomycetota bacterium]
MFGAIARRYDRTNTVLSAGVHHGWRRALVRWSGAAPGMRVLDCATGTGDLALAFRRVVGPAGRVAAVDFCPEMLARAPAKARRQGLDIQFALGDVLALPYGAGCFDMASIAFGIRNVSDPVRGLAEMSRVVRPGGAVLVLEFGQVALPVLRRLFEGCARRLLPRLGGWLTGNRAAYEYLERSRAAMPCGADFVELLRQTGRLEHPEYRALTGGIAYLYRGRVAYP